MVYRAGHLPALPVRCHDCPIRQRTICRPLDGDELHILEDFKTGDVALPPGQALYRPGEASPNLYNLLHGWVMLYQLLPSGRHQILDFALPGRFLGYQPNLHGPMLHGAQCLTDVAVCVFPRRQFPALIEENPKLAIRLLRLMSREVVFGNDRLTNVGSRSARSRIAHFLLDLCFCLRDRGLVSSNQIIEMPLTQSHIAEALGFSSVYVSQTLKQLRRQGLLMFKNGRLQILDLERLTETAELDDPSLVHSRLERESRIASMQSDPVRC